MKMKKVLTSLLAFMLGVTCCFTAIGCGDKNVDMDALTAKIKEGQGLTTEQLVEKAKGESGDFIAYGNTSRITTAMPNFVKAYGEKIGLKDSQAKAQKLDDSKIYTNLENEKKNPGSGENASMVLIQNSADLEIYRNDKEPVVTNYIPNGMSSKMNEKDLVPLAHQFINKLFMYNVKDTNNTLKFTNVWQLTDAAYKDKIYFKSPKNEQVNKNFLIMLTNNEWSAKLEAAYKKLHNNEAATDVGEGKTYKNYGYKWVAEFLKNCNFKINSDTTIAQDLSKDTNAGKMGLFVLSKLRDASVKGENLQVSAWDKKEGSNDFEKIDPFAGFMYSIYAQIATYGNRPYTAMLFINYLMTDEGFTPWKSLGGYSANKEIPVYTGKITTPVYFKDTGKQIFLDNNKKEMLLNDEKNADGKKVYTYIENGELTDKTVVEGAKIDVKGEQKELKATGKTTDVTTVEDSSLDFWNQNLVVEDGNYINTAMAGGIDDWINKQLA